MRKQFCYLMAVIAALSLGLVSCGGGGGNNNNGGGQTVSVTGVSLNKNTMTLTAGSSETLTPTITPSNATNKGVAWTSSNNAIASVSGGRVTAIAQGSATITVRTVDGNHTATCAVTVSPATTTVPVTGVTLNKNTMTLTVGGTEQLTHAIQPTNATNQNVTWETSNSAAATVTNGLVTAIAQGSATITVRTNDGGYTATCSVTVNPATTTVPVTGVSLNKNTMTLTVGGTEQLTHTIQPSNATNQNVTWESNNSAVATVNNGLVTAVAQGNATITVRTNDGNHTATCVVTVVGSATGTPDTSWYYNNPTATTFTIYNADQLAGLATLVNNGIDSFSGKTIILGNNIDLSAYASGEGWTPIGGSYNNGYRHFSGSFNGDGKTISNLTINRTSDYIGLFGYVSNGTVQNLGVVNASIKGYGFVGGIAGCVYTSSITNCYSTGAVSNTFNTIVGGIAGLVENNSSITNCYSTGTIRGSSNNYRTVVGGIVGYLYSSSITNGYSTGAVSGTGYFVGGGIAGLVYGSSSIKGCAALNVSVIGSGDSSSDIGRVAGDAYAYNGEITLSNNIAWSGMLVNGSTVSGTANNQHGANKTGAEIRNGSAFNGMFTDSVWTKQNGYLPGLFGQTVPIPAHIN